MKLELVVTLVLKYFKKVGPDEISAFLLARLTVNVDSLFSCLIHSASSMWCCSASNREASS